MSLADQASLLLIPSGYKESKIYSVFPTTGVGDFTFNRNSSATRIAKNGLITSVATDVPRLEYPLIDGVVNGCPSLLLEPQRTNLLQYSEAFNNAYWIKSGSSVTSGFASPSGDLSSFKLATDTSNGIHYITKTVTSSLGKKTFSFYVDYTKNDYVSCSMTYNTNSRGVGIIINLTNDAVFDSINSNTDYTLNIKTVGNFKRIELSAQNTVDDILNTIFISPYNGEEYTWNNAKKTPSYQGDGTSGVYIYGAQLEEGSFPTSYIPNYGTAAGVTRSAETANGAGDATTFNDSEGVLMVEVRTKDDGLNKFITLSDGTDDNRITIYFYTSINDDIRFQIRSNNINQSLGANPSGYNIDEFNKIAIKYKQNDASVYVNGLLAYEVSTLDTPLNLSELAFDDGGGGSDFYGKTKQIQYFDTALNDSELEQLTSWTSFTDMANGQLYSIK